MRRPLLSVVLAALPFFGYSQIFQENFDGSGPGIAAWTVIDADGLVPAEGVAFITNGWNRIDRDGDDGIFGGPAGNYAAMSTSWYDPAGTSNDWLISPQITVSGASPTLYWDAKAQDPQYRDGYKVMLAPNGGNTVADFTVELFTTAGENGAWTSRAADLTPYIGQNIRIAFVNNSNDKFMLLVDNIKVNPIYTPVYCNPIIFEDSIFGEPGDEPITQVTFAGINNTTSNTAYTGNSHELFLEQTASVAQGQSYDITLKGNTGGNFASNFAVFIDWNQNGILDDAGEVYQVTQTIQNSTGIDALQAVHTISVPANALLGTTRMRVKKMYGTTNLLNPCTGGTYGQVEEYTVTVNNTLAVQDTAKKETSFRAYPNPVTDILNVESKDKIQSVNVYDASGRSVLKAEINSSKSNLNLSGLNAGTYIVTAQTENGTQSVKVIKK
ncbi:MAG: choice-of-anchor J domain-containing protein [Chryseobacterium sp.]|jgi:hypothetical protein|uniref:T9SS-dependent choice-of-anchor J family protein n=1 Tax=Chryseobacterium sp. TaxID=1871047 RepID=UPI0028246506|nr:choice-of-anchor J domain-containing protein [Chryseobacterium sp.]MDR2236973.1 choice-of-anchor J domain-containing protein [Chryseobacterium sp.]